MKYLRIIAIYLVPFALSQQMSKMITIEHTTTMHNEIFVDAWVKKIIRWLRHTHWRWRLRGLKGLKQCDSKYKSGFIIEWSSTIPKFPAIYTYIWQPWFSTNTSNLNKLANIQEQALKSHSPPYSTSPWNLYKLSKSFYITYLKYIPFKTIYSITYTCSDMFWLIKSHHQDNYWIIYTVHQVTVHSLGSQNVYVCDH